MTQTNTTTLNALKKQPQQKPSEIVRAGFDTAEGFSLMQRGASLLASSTIVPSQYRIVNVKKNKYGEITKQEENPSAISNCVVALNMAQRMGADPLMIMQNLYIVEGRPAWSSQYIIASINACGKYSPLRFRMEDLGEKDVEYIETSWVNGAPNKVSKILKIHDVKCIAWALEKNTNEILESPPVTIELAVKEGWYSKNGSKWQTMPEVMLRYRSASFFGKLYAPELLMGIQTVEEVDDTTYDMEESQGGSYKASIEVLRNEKKALDQEVAQEPAKQTSAKEEKKQTPQAGIENKTKVKKEFIEKANQQVNAYDTQSYTVTCPNTGKLVDELECAQKQCRVGCPAFE